MIEDHEGYYLSQDNDCHWYVIPTEHRDEWHDFLNLDTDDPTSWDVPEWAYSVGGSPSLIVFHSYERA